MTTKTFLFWKKNKYIFNTECCSFPLNPPHIKRRVAKRKERPVGRFLLSQVWRPWRINQGCEERGLLGQTNLITQTGVWALGWLHWDSPPHLCKGTPFCPFDGLVTSLLVPLLLALIPLLFPYLVRICITT